MTSSTTAIAIPMPLRVAVLASAAIGCARPKEKITTSSPSSITLEILMSGSLSQYTPSRLMSRCSSHGRNATFSANVSSADRYRWFCPVRQARSSVAPHRSAP